MATPCLILYRDESDEIDFSGPAWDLDAPLTNLLDPRPSITARSVNVAAANTKFFAEFPTAVAVPAVVLVGTNLDINATYIITAYSDAGHTTPTFTTGTQLFWTSTHPITDWDQKGVDLVALFNQTVTARYWQIELINIANTAGYIEISRLHFGTQLALTYGMGVGSSFSRDPNTTVTKTLGGTPYFNKHRNIRKWTLTLLPESPATAWEEIDRMVESCGIDRFVYIVAFPDDIARAHHQSFLGTLGTVREMSFIAGDYVSTGFEIVEYVG